ncbi:hypothetical protein MLD38_030464 [Melastoma candidum]|uniref:Uncharacterized protein n=2 Tax=Melastoma candidum TaxID=119954 RepID=A0ACB9MLW4_9MYRT|nr:hypothetical protein MLD38_030464 [Melastoma candidum]
MFQRNVCTCRTSYPDISLSRRGNKVGTMKTILPALVLINVVLALSNSQAEAQLEVGYYHDKCFLAELVVKAEVFKALVEDPGLAASLVRLHFHDCFVRGCDGSVLLDSTPNKPAEKDSPINNPSLRGFDIIDKAKAKIESVCKGVVSCADIVAFAARDGVEFSGGTGYEVPAGRRDGLISNLNDTFANLPPPTDTLQQLITSFTSKGLTEEDLITLYGAHTIGRSHCTSFTNRLYNFSANAYQDPTLDPSYATELKTQCPNPNFFNDTFLVVPMDPITPTIFDVNYYIDVVNNKGLFTSDETLLSSPTTGELIRQNIAYPKQWESNFAASMVKMGQIQVLTGDAGEIRTNCRKING